MHEGVRQEGNVREIIDISTAAFDYGSQLHLTIEL